jgi:hypothetical protein
MAKWANLLDNAKHFSRVVNGAICVVDGEYDPETQDHSHGPFHAEGSEQESRYR